MNLKDITDEVNSALDYNPDLEAYKSQVARVINRHYLQISSQYNWLFRQKRVPLTLRADITGDATTNKISVGRSSDGWDASNVLYFEGTAETLPTREMLGNVLILGRNTTYLTETGVQSISHGSEEREFNITGIFDLLFSSDHYGHTGRYGGTDSDEWPDGYKPGESSGIVIDRPVIDPSVGTTSLSQKNYYEDWKIEFRQYYLPSDCVEVLGIVDRGLKTPIHTESSSIISTSLNTAPDRGRLIFIDASKEEHLYLDRDSTGDPVIGIEGMPVSITPPMFPPKVSFIDKDPDDSIKKHGAMLAENTYEWCYTFVYKGIESAPSPVTRRKTPDRGPKQYLAEIEGESVEGDFTRNGVEGRTLTSNRRNSDSGDTATSKRMNGRVKRWYRRKVMEPGDEQIPNQGYQRWLHIGDQFTDGKILDLGAKQTIFRETSGGSKAAFPNEFESSATYGSDIDVIGWPQAYWLKQGYWTYHDGELQKLKVLDESGPRQTIRIYRPPSQDMDVEIRYLARPKRLVADSDAPEWPVQYHHLLVYMALADICLQHGMNNQATLYERKSEELLDRMKQKYLSRTNRKYIRRGFDRVVFAGERFGVPTKV